MATLTHFDMIGYPLDLQDESRLERVLGPLAESCRPTALSAQDIACLVADASGGELRLGLHREANGQLSLVAFNPAYAGLGRLPVKIVGDASDPEWKTFEITVQATFGADDVPIIFDLADPAQAALVKSGARLTAQISAFCFEPEVFADEDAYYAAQSGKVKFAANFFIPSGTFTQEAGGAMAEGGKRPVAYADFAGTVVKAELKTNGQGHERFWWALVRTMDGVTIDVLAAESAVKVPLKPGAVITGRFWLSARLSPAG